MTSELGEMFNEAKKYGQEKRRENRQNSRIILEECKVEFTVHNEGAHLIAVHDGRTADFWPGTGKYRVRGVTGYRRGVFNLLRDLGVPRGEPRKGPPPGYRYPLDDGEGHVIEVTDKNGYVKDAS